MGGARRWRAGGGRHSAVTADSASLLPHARRPRGARLHVVVAPWGAEVHDAARVGKTAVARAAGGQQRRRVVPQQRHHQLRRACEGCAVHGPGRRQPRAAGDRQLTAGATRGAVAAHGRQRAAGCAPAARPTARWLRAAQCSLLTAVVLKGHDAPAAAAPSSGISSRVSSAGTRPRGASCRGSMRAAARPADRRRAALSTASHAAQRISWL